ncbi:MAG TPA: hypothetical protein VGL48_07175 [Acidimicrobiales bacterium]
MGNAIGPHFEAGVGPGRRLVSVGIHLTQISSTAQNVAGFEVGARRP